MAGGGTPMQLSRRDLNRERKRQVFQKWPATTEQAVDAGQTGSAWCVRQGGLGEGRVHREGQ